MLIKRLIFATHHHFLSLLNPTQGLIIGLFQWYSKPQVISPASSLTAVSLQMLFITFEKYIKILRISGGLLRYDAWIKQNNSKKNSWKAHPGTESDTIMIKYDDHHLWYLLASTPPTNVWYCLLAVCCYLHTPVSFVLALHCLLL